MLGSAKKGLRFWRDSFRGIPPKIWLLTFVNFVNRCGGMVVAFLTIYLTKELHFSIEQAGYVLSFFGFGAIAGALAGGWLTKRFGWFSVQFVSLVLQGLMLISLLWVRDFWPMCAAIAATSFISEVFRPAGSVSVVIFSDESNRTRSFSLLRLAYNLGWTVAPAAGGIIAFHWGWHALFWIDGITCIAAAFALWIFVYEKESSTAPIEDSKQEAAAASPQSEKSPWVDPYYLLFSVCTFLGALVFMQMIWTVPLYYKNVFLWTEEQIGWTAALNGAIVALIEMPLVFWIEKKRPQLTWVRLGFVCYAVSYLALYAIDPRSAQFMLFAALAYTIMASVGEIFVMPFSTTWVTLRAGKTNQASYLAVYTLSYSVSSVVAPLMGTQIIDRYGYNALWLTLVFLTAISWSGLQHIQRKAIVPALGALR